MKPVALALALAACTTLPLHASSEGVSLPQQVDTTQAPAAAQAPAPLPEAVPAPREKPFTLPRHYKPTDPIISHRSQGSTYIPMDSWMYPALVRLQALGYLDTAFLGIRPWTRLSVAHMLQKSDDQLLSRTGTARDEALEIFLALQDELGRDDAEYRPHADLDTVYTRFLGITDTPLNDSYHLGQTIYNDYGRPYQAGVNNVTGASGRAEYGRFSAYVRGEYQQAPSAQGYDFAQFTYLSQVVDFTPVASNPVQDTIPLGPIASVKNFRLLEAYASYHIWNHEISFGKNDHWLGPAKGGSFAWSNNADNIYAFQIDRVEPVRVPLLSRVTGPFRYNFFVGSLQGHTAPNDPWVHSEKLSFKPSPNLEIGFERTVIWGGRGHEPITIHTFLKSFFSFQNVTGAEKFSPHDPGARFGSFDFSYRLPFVRNWLTLYTDSIAHDDVSPISAPRRAGFRPGIYLSHVPTIPKLDLRIEGFDTDPVTSRSNDGSFLEYEGVQRQGITNKGVIFGDAGGREDKGGQAWITYHLSPTEHALFTYRNIKAAKDFIPGGTTQNQYKVELVKRITPELELNAWAQYERWKAPFYKPGLNTDTTVTGQLTWFPHKTRVWQGK